MGTGFAVGAVDNRVVAVVVGVDSMAAAGVEAAGAPGYSRSWVGAQFSVLVVLGLEVPLPPRGSHDRPGVDIVQAVDPEVGQVAADNNLADVYGSSSICLSPLPILQLR